jgi:cadmium resistance protein CadD (predicted permease)
MHYALFQSSATTKENQNEEAIAHIFNSLFTHSFAGPMMNIWIFFPLWAIVNSAALSIDILVFI